MKNLIILGAGTGGTMVANRAVRELPAGWWSTWSRCRSSARSPRSSSSSWPTNSSPAGGSATVELIFATPLDGAFTKPACSTALAYLLERKGITVGRRRRAGAALLGRAGDPLRPAGRDPHPQGCGLRRRLGLGNELDFVPTERHTLLAMSGIEATLFFTFWGLDVVNESKIDHLHVATVGNPRCPSPPCSAGCRAWSRWRPR